MNEVEKTLVCQKELPVKRNMPCGLRGAFRMGIQQDPVRYLQALSAVVAIGLASLLVSSRLEAVCASTGTVNIFIYNGPQDWNNVIVSTAVVTSTATASVALSSCTIMQADPYDCYYACIQGNGTLSASPARWVVCPK